MNTTNLYQQVERNYNFTLSFFEMLNKELKSLEKDSKKLNLKREYDKEFKEEKEENE